MKISVAGTLLALAFAAPAHAATTIDFSGETGSYSGNGDDLTVEVTGGPGPSGAAAINHGGVTNSVTGAYPTGQFLNFVFDDLASDISLTFNNLGSSGSGRGNSSYAMFDATDNLIASGLLPQGSSMAPILLGGSDVSLLRLSNGTDGSESWIFSVGQLSYTAGVGAVPEPSTWALLIFGFLAMGAAMRRREKHKVAVSYSF